MKRLIILLALGLMAVSCSSVNTNNAGMLYTSAKSSTAVGTGGKGMKTGEACSSGLIGIVTGDSSIEAAMAAGSISKVAYVDHTAKSVLGFYTKYCTIVHGK